MLAYNHAPHQKNVSYVFGFYSIVMTSETQSKWQGNIQCKKHSKELVKQERKKNRRARCRVKGEPIINNSKQAEKFLTTNYHVRLILWFPSSFRCWEWSLKFTAWFSQKCRSPNCKYNGLYVWNIILNLSHLNLFRFQI